MRQRPTAELVAWGVALLCAGASAACTVGAMPNGAEASVEGDYLAVGALVAEGTAFCSGTLVGPRTVLTAGHCVAGAIPNVSFFIGADVDAGGVSIDVVAMHPHPDHALSESSNIGVALLAEAAPVAALEFAPGVPDELIGSEVRLIGYAAAAFSSDRTSKRRIELPLTKLGERSFLVAGDAPRKDCESLLGGPVVAEVDGREVMLGVTSNGDHFCRNQALSTRIDAHPDFLARFELDDANIADECDELGWYGDGFCDELCPMPDPDCDELSGDICEDFGWYDDQVCDTFCPMPDPDCAEAEPEATSDICTANGWYGDGECDTFCPAPDPDCM